MWTPMSLHPLRGSLCLCVHQNWVLNHLCGILGQSRGHGFPFIRPRGDPRNLFLPVLQGDLLEGGPLMSQYLVLCSKAESGFVSKLSQT
jgi:hypothetical protein